RHRIRHRHPNPMTGLHCRETRWRAPPYGCEQWELGTEYPPMALYEPVVLVAYILDNYISILQTKFSDREGHEARRIGLETMPLDQHIEDGHGEGEARLKIGPAPVHDLFEMADQRQHGEHRLDEHTVLPLPALTEFEVGGVALGGMETGITQDNHPPIKLLNQPLKGVIRDIGRGTVPPHNQPPLVEQQTEFAPDNPAMVR